MRTTVLESELQLAWAVKFVYLPLETQPVSLYALPDGNHNNGVGAELFFSSSFAFTNLHGVVVDLHMLRVTWWLLPFIHLTHGEGFCANSPWPHHTWVVLLTNETLSNFSGIILK
jgi:hypothetical protein